MKLFKNFLLPFFDWILIIISLGLIIFVSFTLSFNQQNSSDLQSSVQKLSEPDTTVEALKNASRNLLLSESNFRIFLTTHDTLYKNKFLTNIYATVNRFKQIEQTGNKKEIDSIIQALGNNIQLSGMIEHLKNMADSILYNASNIGSIKYNNNDFLQIDTSMLKKFTVNKTDTIFIDSLTQQGRKKGFFNRLFGGKKKDTVKVQVKKRTSDNKNREQNLDSISINTHSKNIENKKLNSLLSYIHRSYKNSIKKEIELQRKIADNEKELAQNNLIFINNSNIVVQQVIEKLEDRDKLRNNSELNKISKINFSNSKQIWWIAILTTLAAVFVIIRIVKKTDDLNK